MGWRSIRYDTVDSTNERALEALAAGDARHGDVFIARRQTAGRGTRGREWVSGDGGLYLSAVLESPALPPAGMWTIAGALAAHDACEHFDVPARLDWPNDLVSLRGEKLAGILAEARGLGRSGPATFVLGIGMNVTNTPSDDVGRSTASLRSLGADVDVESCEAALVDALVLRTAQALSNTDELYRAFFDRCMQAGERVEVELADTRIRGTLTSIDPERGVRVVDDDGSARTASLAHVRAIRLEGTPQGT